MKYNTIYIPYKLTDDFDDVISTYREYNVQRTNNTTVSGVGFLFPKKNVKVRVFT